jgi:hypothetical protein
MKPMFNEMFWTIFTRVTAYESVSGKLVVNVPAASTSVVIEPEKVPENAS